MTRTTVIATWTIDGFHNWPDAPEQFDHLEARHRHRFRWRVEVEVWPAAEERQIEFQHLGDQLRALIVGGRVEPVEFGASSCEDLALLTANDIAVLHQQEDVDRFVAVEVWEDDNHGARLETTI